MYDYQNDTQPTPAQAYAESIRWRDEYKRRVRQRVKDRMNYALRDVCSNIPIDEMMDLYIEQLRKERLTQTVPAYINEEMRCG